MFLNLPGQCKERRSQPLPEGLCRCHRPDVGCVGVRLDANPEGRGVPIVLEPRPLPFQLTFIGPLPIPL